MLLLLLLVMMMMMMMMMTVWWECQSTWRVRLFVRFALVSADVTCPRLRFLASACVYGRYARRRMRRPTRQLCAHLARVWIGSRVTIITIDAGQSHYCTNSDWPPSAWSLLEIVCPKVEKYCPKLEDRSSMTPVAILVLIQVIARKKMCTVSYFTIKMLQ